MKVPILGRVARPAHLTLEAWSFITVQNLSASRFVHQILHICRSSRTRFAELSISLPLYIFSQMKDGFVFFCARVKFMVDDTRWQQREMSF